MPSSDPWCVIWTKSARRSLAHVPPRIVPAVLSFAQERLADNPWRMTHRLDAPLDGLRSGSVGSYRVLVKLDDAARTVSIIRVAYHANVSRPS
ncbi:MAG: hypothetical protein FWF75_02200 [Propionibacteriaceae bacterium]|nr:hypothetical protein [Propionibacteriaceae bacterium]